MSSTDRYQEIDQKYKKCNSCGEKKEIRKFYIRKYSSGNVSLRYQCKKCDREFDRKSKKDRYKKVMQYKIEHGCIECGYDDHPFLLDFDHPEEVEKVASVSELICGEYSENKIWKEIKKCDVICKKHHIMRSDNRYDERTPRQMALEELELEGKI